jgi:hypothetical protein
MRMRKQKQMQMRKQKQKQKQKQKERRIVKRWSKSPRCGRAGPCTDDKRVTTMPMSHVLSIDLSIYRDSVTSQRSL